MATQGRRWIGGLAAGWVLAAGCSANGPGEAARGPAAGSDGPLATLEGARDRLRQLRSGGGPATAATVMVRGGTYVFDRAVEFGAQDSGAEGAPVAYVAEPGTTVRLSGGREVTGWRPVTDAAALARLPEASRGWAAVADLRAQGLTNWGQIPVRGFGPKGGLAEAELFFDDVPMRLARWPDAGFRGIVNATNATERGPPKPFSRKSRYCFLEGRALSRPHPCVIEACERCPPKRFGEDREASGRPPDGLTRPPGASTVAGLP